MVNLLITMKCNRSCSYCFAKEKLDSYSTSNAITHMSMENFGLVQAFLERSNCKVLQLAGGEPTMHPQFEQILLSLIKNKVTVNLLSNALWNPELNELFAEISPSALGFLLNIDQPKTYSPSELERLEINLTSLKGRSNVTLSFNIFEPNPDYNYIFDLTSKYGFKTLRLSFSMPVNFRGRKNAYLKIDEYKNSAKDVMDFAKKAEVQGVKTGLDNTVPICMFNAEQLLELMIKQVIEPSRNFVCNPAIDIGPDLSVWRCFGTSKLFNRQLQDFSSIQEVYDYYQRMSRLYQFKFFPYNECTTCEYAKEELCQGGCIGFAEEKCNQMGCFVNEPMDEAVLKMKFRVSPKISLRKYSIPEETRVLHFDDGGEMVVSESMVGLLAFFDGNTTLVEAIKKIMGGSENPETSDAIDDLLVEVSAKQLLPVIRRMISEEVLVI